MKGNELDELFKQKLGHRKLTPPAGSWDKIENNLSEKKTKGFVWLAVAASIGLIFTIGWLVWPQGEDAAVTTDQLAETEKPEIIKEATQEPSPETLVTEVPKESDEKTTTQKFSPTRNTTKSTIASPAFQATNNLSTEEIQLTPEQAIRTRLTEVSKIELNHVVNLKSLQPNFKNHSVLPLDVSLMHTYADEGDQEIRKPKKFRLVNGFISIAKGVNKSKIGLEKLRNAKNDFITDELKYGVQQAEEEEKEKPKETKDGTNADQQELNK